MQTSTSVREMMKRYVESNVPGFLGMRLPEMDNGRWRVYVSSFSGEGYFYVDGDRIERDSFTGFVRDKRS